MVMTLLTRPKKTVATVVIATDGSGDFNTDGIDDDVEIQAAIDSLPASGGCVYFKEGVYTLTATITITINNVGLIGCGRCTQITTAGDITLLDATNVTGILVEKIYFYGSGAGNPLNSGITFGGTTDDSMIRNCWIENCGHVNGGISLYAGNNEIISCVIENNQSRGIYSLGVRNRIVSNYIYDNSSNAGIYSEGQYCVVTNNICNSNRWGIVVSEGDYTVVNGNIITNSITDGIITVGGPGSELHDCIISNNVVESCDQHGIELTYLDHSVIDGNVCYNNDADNTATYSGIYLANCDNNIISNNRCRENDNYEINISNAGCNKNLVEGNICIGTDHVGTINDSGTNTQIFNNVES